MYSHDEQTIIAQCTPQGSGALALLRLSGNQAVEIATQIGSLPNNKKLSDQNSHTVHFGRIHDDTTTLDQCMFILMRGPRTFTGQDTVEITCHNNPFIIASIIELCIHNGARLAQPGEFAQRAVLHKKMDVLQAEALHELIHANTAQALKKSLAQLEGSFSHEIAHIEKNLLRALALSESSFEFIDEAIEFGTEIKEIITATQAIIEKTKKNFDQQIQIRQGIRIALIGSVNAGKSSLFNALLDKSRAIVTNIPGTTRDVIEAGMYKNNSYWTLIDTAGLRTTNDAIEAEGIRRSHQEAHRADIILLVIDQSKEISSTELQVYRSMLNTYPTKIMVVQNKSDLPCLLQSDLFDNPLQISTHDRNSIAHLAFNIEQKIDALLAQADAPFLLNKRQFNLMLTLEKQIADIFSLLQSSTIHYELLSYHLNDALAQLSELTGKTVSEQSMDAIFREFCIGK